MSHVRRFIRRIATLLRSGQADRELSREIEAHLQLLEDEFVARGMPRDEARYAARREFHGVEQTKELQRDARSFRWLAGWPMDMKLGVRMLVKSPGLTVIAVVALAVAIGGGAAYVEFIQDLIHPSLPGPGGDRIVTLQIWDQQKGEPERRTVADYRVWRDQLTTVEELGARTRLDRNLITGDGRAEPARGVEISASAFRLFPTPPLVGRTIVEGDEHPNAPPVVLIGQEIWHTRFGSDPAVVGKVVRLGTEPHTVIGVMPREFGFPTNHNLWVPFKVPSDVMRRGEGPEIRIFGRLIEGLSIDAATAELHGLLSRSEDSPSPYLRADVRGYLDSLMANDPESRLQVMILYAANIIFLGLLGICGANVATLVFARTATRESEITVRTALGASRGRISAQLFAEALVLSILAAVIGLSVAGYALRWATAIFAEVAAGSPMPFWWNDRLSPPTIFYAFLLAVVAALIVGVIPALKATGAELQGRLREAGPSGASMKFGRLWTGIIITQVAITMIFLVSVASLGWTALTGLYEYDVTFPRAQYLIGRISLEIDADRKASSEQRAAAYRRTLTEITRTLASNSQVVSVAHGQRLPGAGADRFRVELSQPQLAGKAGDGPVLWVRSGGVGPTYFQTFNIPLAAGRYFSQGEIDSAHNVAIVDETFVRLVLGGRNAVGQMVREATGERGTAPGPWLQIVGVVKDVTVKADKKTQDAHLYRPIEVGNTFPVHVIVQTRGDAALVAAALRAAAISADPTLRLTEVMTMDHLADDDRKTISFFLTAFSVVAGVALLLSTAGIYSLIAFTLARRTREIGIRMALGAEPRRIITAIFSRAFVQIAIGIAAGAIPGAAIMSLGLEDAGSMGLVPGIITTAGVAAFIILVALAACLVPLRRALRIEPNEALRS